MRITLNLATRPFADLGPAIKRLRIAMGALALAAVVLLLGLRALDEKAQKARAREHALDAQIARLKSERQGYQNMMQEPANAKLLTQAETLNKLFDEKSFSWTLAMEDLETVLPGGVQVATLEPVRAKDGHITLHLRVIGPRDRAIELVRNLEHSKRFVLPRIVGENSESNGGPGERFIPVSESSKVDFDLLADYNPPLPGERTTAKSEAQAAGASTPVHARPNPGRRAAIPAAKLPAGPRTGSPAVKAPRPPYTGTSHPAAPQPVRSGPNGQGSNAHPGGRP